ncbi:MAG: hypothetical protein ABR599_07930 [Gemmatimonadota bacterium]
MADTSGSGRFSFEDLKALLGNLLDGKPAPKEQLTLAYNFVQQFPPEFGIPVALALEETQGKGKYGIIVPPRPWPSS